MASNLVKKIQGKTRGTRYAHKYVKTTPEGRMARASAAQTVKQSRAKTNTENERKARQAKFMKTLKPKKYPAFG